MTNNLELLFFLKSFLIPHFLFFSVNKVTIVVPRRKSKKVVSVLKDLSESKYIKLVAGSYHKFEVFVTELRTQDLVKELKEELDIRTGKSTKEGYLTVHSTNIVAPTISEKGKERELEELTRIDAKKFVRLDDDYLLFTVCAAIIATFGFMIDNVFVLIGAMLLSPLMYPIMAVSYGWARSQGKLVRAGLKAELVGVSLSVIASLVTSLFLLLFPNPNLELEFSFALTSPFLTFMIALMLGLIAANSFYRGQFESLTGVAVSISLLPPLVNFVILFLAGESASLQSLLLFVLSVVGIHASSYVLFRVMRNS